MSHEVYTFLYTNYYKSNFSFIPYKIKVLAQCTLTTVITDIINTLAEVKEARRE